MLNTNAIANLQMLMNIGDGRHAVLAELLQTEKAVAGIWHDHNNHVAQPSCAVNLEIGANPTQSTRLPQLVIKAPPTPSTLPENIIALLDQLALKENVPLITFAEDLAYHYNNLFMALIGHISIVMHPIKPSHPSYDRFRECEELILNTAMLIRLLIDVFRRSDDQEETLYPIDLSDREIHRRIFPQHPLRQSLSKMSDSASHAQQILIVVADHIARTLKRTLLDMRRIVNDAYKSLALKTTRIFNWEDMQVWAAEHHQAIELHLKRGIAIANDLLDYANAAEAARWPSCSAQRK
jgi:hypothetical protein